MKKAFFTALLFAAGLLVHAQTSDRLYGFRQGVIPGTKKAVEIETGGQVTKIETTSLFQYLIYLTTAVKARMYPVQLWLNGEAFAANSVIVTDTQFLHEAAKQHGEKSKSFAYQARTTIYKLTPVPLAIDKSTDKGKTLSRSHAVVLLYKRNGKLHYGVLKKFTDVAPVALQ